MTPERLEELREHPHRAKTADVRELIAENDTLWAVYRAWTERMTKLAEKVEKATAPPA